MAVWQLACAVHHEELRCTPVQAGGTGPRSAWLDVTAADDSTPLGIARTAERPMLVKLLEKYSDKPRDTAAAHTEAEGAGA